MIFNKYKKGFSLVELMVSLTISVVFVGTAASLLSRNKTDFVPLRDSARMNEGAMAVFDIIERELEQAGYFGENEALKTRDYVQVGAVAARFVSHVSDVSQPSDLLFGLGRRRVGGVARGAPLSTAVEGFEGTTPGSGFFPSGTQVFDDTKALTDADTGILPTTDAITIRGSLAGNVDIQANGLDGLQVGRRGAGVRLAQSSLPNANTLQLVDGSTLPLRGYFIIYDGQNTELFKATRSGNTLTVEKEPRYLAGTDRLRYGFASLLVPGTPVGNGQSYVTVAQASRYYVGNYENPDGDLIPSLYREFYSPNADNNNGAVVRDEQVLIEGVENMQITYGENTVGSGGIDVYARADQVVNWDNVKAVKISLLVRSESGSSVDATTGSQAYQVNDQLVVPGTSDRFIRKVYTTQITLDNGV